MTVVVAEADGDDRRTGMSRVEEGRRGVRRPVVGHLEHIGGQVGAGGEDRVLLLDLRVTGQQKPGSSDGRSHHERGVVRVRSGPVRRCSRAEYLEADGAGADRRPRARAADDQMFPSGDPGDQFLAALRFGERAGHDLSDRASADGTGEAGHVIGVQVRDHDQRQSSDVEVVQTPIDGDRVRPGVDQHRRAGTGVEHE